MCVRVFPVFTHVCECVRFTDIITYMGVCVCVFRAGIYARVSVFLRAFMCACVNRVFGRARVFVYLVRMCA